MPTIPKNQSKTSNLERLPSTVGLICAALGPCMGRKAVRVEDHLMSMYTRGTCCCGISCDCIHGPLKSCNCIL